MTAGKSNCETNNRKKMGQTTLTLSKAELSDLNEILELQKEAYIQEARIYNNFEIDSERSNVMQSDFEWFIAKKLQ